MMSSQLVTWAIATGVAVVVPRFLGPSALGELRLAGSLWLIAGTVAALGTSRFLQLAVARSPSEGVSLVGTVLVLRTLAFGACALVVAGYVALTSQSTQFGVIVVLLGIGTLLSTWTGAFNASFVGLEHMSTAAFGAAATRLVEFLLVVSVLAAGAGVIGVVGVGVATSIGGLVYIAWRFRTVGTVEVRGSSRRLRSVVRASRTYMAAGVALVLYQQIDLVVISLVADSEDLGWYGAADTLFGSLLFPATVIMAVIFPTLGRLHTGDPADLEKLVTRAFGLLAAVAVPVGLGTTLVAPGFAPVLYGEDFRETGVVLAILGPVIVLTFGTILFGTVALATERGRVWVYVMLAAAALTVPLDLILVPMAEGRWDNGAIGGALAYLVTEALQFAIGVVIIAPYLLTKRVLWRSARILIAGLVMFALVWPLRSYPIPVPVVVGALVYGLAVMALGVLTEDERSMLRRALGRLTGRRSRR